MWFPPNTKRHPKVDGQPLHFRAGYVMRCCFLALMICFGPSEGSAQSASFRSVDTNSDGVLSFDELSAVFGASGADRLMRSNDHNGDGQISIRELRRSAGDDRSDRDEDDAPDRDDDQDDDGDDDRDDDGDSDGGDDGGGDSDSDGGGADD